MLRQSNLSFFSLPPPDPDDHCQPRGVLQAVHGRLLPHVVRGRCGHARADRPHGETTRPPPPPPLPGHTSPYSTIVAVTCSCWTVCFGGARWVYASWCARFARLVAPRSDGGGGAEREFFFGGGGVGGRAWRDEAPSAICCFFIFSGLSLLCTLGFDRLCRCFCC